MSMLKVKFTATRERAQLSCRHDLLGSLNRHKLLAEYLL